LRYLSCATNSFIGPPHPRVENGVPEPGHRFDLRVRRVSLFRSSNDRKRGETFPQFKISEPNEAIPLDVVAIKQRRIRSAAMMKFERVPSAAPLTAIDIAPQCRLADGRRESATAVSVPSCIHVFLGVCRIVGLLKRRGSIWSVLQLAFERLDLLGKGAVIAGQIFDFAHRMKHGGVVATAEAAANLGQ
jgi:hypothetical protein